MTVRRYPPVYTPIDYRAFGEAVLSLLQSTQRIAAEAQASLREMLPGRDAVICDSGTSALTLALLASTRKGVERVVALPAYCCPDVGTAAIAAGYRVQLYDSDPDTLQPDWDSVVRCISRGATTLVIAHLFGRIIDVDQAHDISRQHGTIVIEDAAQGAGGSLRGITAGGLAQYSVLSFGRGKGMNACGGGAFTYAIPSSDDQSGGEGHSRHSSGLSVNSSQGVPQELAYSGFARQAATLCKAVATEVFSSPILYALAALLPGLNIGETIYHTPTPLKAAGAVEYSLIASALKARTPHTIQRQSIEQWYQEMLGEHKNIALAAPLASSKSGALRFPIMLDHSVGTLLSKMGVVRSYPRTLLEYPEIAAVTANDDCKLPGARLLAKKLYTLPTHSLLSNGDREFIVSKLISE